MKVRQRRARRCSRKVSSITFSSVARSHSGLFKWVFKGLPLPVKSSPRAVEVGSDGFGLSGSVI